MINDKNANSTPKCQAKCLVSSCKNSDSLDQQPSFHKCIGKAMSKMHTCTRTLSKNLIQAMHNLRYHSDKKLERKRNSMQKSSYFLDQFWICYEFYKMQMKMK
jgi:hypothetical protein